MPGSLPPLKIDGDKLYPELTPEQRAEAAYNLARYVEIVERIYRRASQLTDNERDGTVQEQFHP